MHTFDAGDIFRSVASCLRKNFVAPDYVNSAQRPLPFLNSFKLASNFGRGVGFPVSNVFFHIAGVGIGCFGRVIAFFAGERYELGSSCLHTGNQIMQPLPMPHVDVASADI